MNIFDIIVGLIAVFVIYKGVKRGLIIELAGLLALGLGIVIAYSFYELIANDYLSNYVDWSPSILKLTSFLGLFIAVAIVINLLGKLLTKLLDIAALGLFNRILGGLFGLLKLALSLVVLHVFLDYVVSVLNVKQLPDFLESSIVFETSREIYKFIMPQVFQLLA